MRVKNFLTSSPPLLINSCGYRNEPSKFTSPTTRSTSREISMGPQSGKCSAVLRLPGLRYPARLEYQRLSNFRPRFTGEELLTTYLFGHMQGFHQQRRIYDYARRHWRAWFPALPSCQAFNRRLNRLTESFEHLITETLAAPVERLADARRPPHRFPAY
jgi:hypothetical protein